MTPHWCCSRAQSLASATPQRLLMTLATCIRIMKRYRPNGISTLNVRAYVRRRELEFQVDEKKCVGDPASVVPLETVAVKDSLSYEDAPVEILDRQVRRLRNKEVALVKVLWRSQSVEGATWEAEAAMKSKYPHLFPSDAIPARGNSSFSVIHA
ncbi:hypothetical protein MTR67_022472 [Solanum verrucosum]|uniref:Uncharacterized protein n=1 Tax=Solanum verrucosum TaxID=315347 RepID=A0AAF0QUX2_SOLVR|nr:hypothetical protein MTR67_022472 [Solanum verrucosum]